MQTITTDVIIVGGGFSGCVALDAMRSAGYSAKLIEASDDFGGVWHSNSYPGARVDGELPFYQLSNRKIWETFTFAQRFPGHEALKEYFSHIANVLKLRKDSIFNTTVSAIAYDASSNLWTVETEQDIRATAQYVILATGTTNKPHIPNFPGLESYTGQIIHPSRWPKNLDLANKAVGIIGQGSSGVQITQELARQNVQLFVFIRNPCIALPMRQRTISKAEAEQSKSFYDTMLNHSKYNDKSGLGFNPFPTDFEKLSLAERREHYQRLWDRGGFIFSEKGNPNAAFDKEANAEVYQFWAEKVRGRVKDQFKRDILAPTEQFQWVGTKRPGLETDYYEVLDKPNVKLVNLKKTPIIGFTETGLKTGNGGKEEFHELDVVVVATGYDSVTGSIFDIDIGDKEGNLLKDKWKNGIYTHLGMMVPGMPNFFIMYGPQAPTALANAPLFIELQTEWIVKILKKAKQENLSVLEVTSEAAKQWRQKVLFVFQRGLARETPSWWTGANIEGKVNEPLIWFGGLKAWWKECMAELQELNGFVK